MNEEEQGWFSEGRPSRELPYENKFQNSITLEMSFIHTNY